jgi:serine/threonine-protein kinase HipA
VIVRVHQEDLCQALGIPPTEKYQNDGGPSPATIASLLRSAMPPRVADEAVWRFADALIWNWLIAGTDGHAKNYSLLLAGDQVRFAPLYDIASALPYGMHEKKLRLAMKIGGDYRIFPERNTWPEAARELGLDPEALVDRVRTLGSLLPVAFAEAAKAPDVVALARPMPDVLVSLVTERAGRCLRLLGGG